MFRMILVCSLAFAMSPLEQRAGSLTAAEQADGWKLLFDGQSLAGWRAYKSTTPPAGWRAVNGELVRDGEGGDLMTVEQFNDFELRLEWKISENGNSGIMYHVVTGDEAPYESGPEFQVLHNAGHKDGASPILSAGSNYAMHPPVKDVTRPVGEWNDIRLIVNGTHVEHWMNGVKLLEFEQFSPDWYARLKASKFSKMPPYGRHMRGHLVLQDHGALVTFRNIKIKTL
jgi:3-keto-disaccharide hydrolase